MFWINVIEMLLVLLVPLFLIGVVKERRSGATVGETKMNQSSGPEMPVVVFVLVLLMGIMCQPYLDDHMRIAGEAADEWGLLADEKNQSFRLLTYMFISDYSVLLIFAVALVIRFGALTTIRLGNAGTAFAFILGGVGSGIITVLCMEYNGVDQAFASPVGGIFALISANRIAMLQEEESTVLISLIPVGAVIVIALMVNPYWSLCAGTGYALGFWLGYICYFFARDNVELVWFAD